MVSWQSVGTCISHRSAGVVAFLMVKWDGYWWVGAFTMKVRCESKRFGVVLAILFRRRCIPMVIWFYMSSGGSVYNPGKAEKRDSRIRFICGASGESLYHAYVLVTINV